MENHIWPGTSPRPGEDGSYEDKPRLTRMGGRVGCQPFPFAASSREMGWSTCNLFHSLICIILRLLITNAKLSLHSYYHSKYTIFVHAALALSSSLTHSPSWFLPHFVNTTSVVLFGPWDIVMTFCPTF